MPYIRRILGLPYNCYNYLLPLLSNSLPAFIEICKHSVHFVSSCLGSMSNLVRFVTWHGMAIARYRSCISCILMRCFVVNILIGGRMNYYQATLIYAMIFLSNFLINCLHLWILIMLVLYLKFYVLEKVFCFLKMSGYTLKRKTWTLLLNPYHVIINIVIFVYLL